MLISSLWKLIIEELIEKIKLKVEGDEGYLKMETQKFSTL